MDDKDIKYQAAAFLYYTDGGGSSDRWWSSKDFSPKDRKKIEAEILRRLKPKGDQS